MSTIGIVRRKKQTASSLDDIPGFGPATRKKLIQKFGSLRGIKLASSEDLAEAIGAKKADILARHLLE